MKFQSKSYKHARALGYRSGLEEKVAKELQDLGVKVSYEDITVTYILPETVHRYTADFILPNGIVIETKGEFNSADRKKHKALKAQSPGIDLRFVFSNPARKIGAKSATTYGMWCTRLGIPFVKGSVPEHWVEEPYDQSKWDAIEAVRHQGKGTKK